MKFVVVTCGFGSALLLFKTKRMLMFSMVLFLLMLSLIIKVMQESATYIPVPQTASEEEVPNDSNKFILENPSTQDVLIVERNAHDRDAAYHAGFQFDRSACGRKHPHFINSTYEPTGIMEIL